jgi:hypothetical protein
LPHDVKWVLSGILVMVPVSGAWRLARGCLHLSTKVGKDSSHFCDRGRLMYWWLSTDYPSRVAVLAPPLMPWPPDWGSVIAITNRVFSIAFTKEPFGAVMSP